MKILCVADIHGSRNELLVVKKIADDEKPDLVLILGDYSGHGGFHDIEGNKNDAKFALETFKDFNVKAIIGNCDNLDVLNVLSESGVNLHEKKEEISGITFIGLGGSNTTPFNTPTEFSEDDIYKKLKKLFEDAKNKKVILATHFPPKDTECDKIASGLHPGSSGLRKIIEEFQPMLNVCSHIHEAGGKIDRIGKTKIASIGPVKNGYGLINLNGKLEVLLPRF